MTSGLDGAGQASQGRCRRQLRGWPTSFTWMARAISSSTREAKDGAPDCGSGLRDSILVQTDDATLLAHKAGAKGKRAGKKIVGRSQIQKLDIRQLRLLIKTTQPDLPINVIRIGRIFSFRVPVGDRWPVNAGGDAGFELSGKT